MKAIIIFLLLFHHIAVFSATIFTINGAESDTDKRHSYYSKILELALVKTIDDYGAYHLDILPSGINVKRAIADVKNGVYENHFVRQSVSLDYLAEMEGVPFPIDLGIVGYRIALTSNNIKKRLMSVDSLEDLKKFTVVQGLGWLDTSILQLNGFIVSEAGSYEGLFQMVARNHGDILTRGVNEIRDEWESHKHIPNLAYDESFVLYYPLPRFFFTLKKNKRSAERVYKGLVYSYEDGSLQKLWREYYGPSIIFAQLESRKLFEINNPFLKGVNKSYQKFLYRPGR